MRMSGRSSSNILPSPCLGEQASLCGKCFRRFLRIKWDEIRSPPAGGTYRRIFMRSFAGKVALITGGSSGIGRAAALRLAGHGAKVARAARHWEAIKQSVMQSDKAGMQ